MAERLVQFNAVAIEAATPEVIAVSAEHPIAGKGFGAGAVPELHAKSPMANVTIKIDLT